LRHQIRVNLQRPGLFLFFHTFIINIQTFHQLSQVLRLIKRCYLLLNWTNFICGIFYHSLNALQMIFQNLLRFGLPQLWWQRLDSLFKLIDLMLPLTNSIF
jgi:hypothetical protein